jgi:hypothetical protein
MRHLPTCPLIVVAIMLALCQEMTAQYKLAGRVIANGGGSTSDGTRRIIGTVGQAAIGSESSTLNKISMGFWYAQTNPVSAVKPEKQSVPLVFQLEQNYPNPFNPTTMISYQLPVASEVRLEVYDMLGRGVAVLVNEKKAPGSYEVRFDASALPSGVYVYRLRAGEFVQVRKLVVLK